VRNGIDREHKLCDVVIGKLTYVSLFITFEDSNDSPFVFNRLRVLEDLGNMELQIISGLSFLGGVHMAAMCVIRRSV
jgi:hypothetical protein